MDCIFCKIVNGEIPSYTIYENEYVKCFLDVKPISKGHILIIPKKHFIDINDIDSEYLFEIQKTSKYIVKLISDKLNPDGIKIVQNNGNIQEVKHYHLHIIPNYINNETNINIEEIYHTLIK